LVEGSKIPPVIIESSTFINGLAYSGGAVAIMGESSVEIRDSKFEYNRAIITGGAILI
jgi:hypothetical protein